MPKMVFIEADPDYKHPNAEAYVAAKKKGPIEVSYATAEEAVRNSDGVYRIQPEKRPAASVQAVALEDLDPEQLKIMAASLGVTIQKEKMMKTDLIRLVRRKLEDVTLTE